LHKLHYTSKPGALDKEEDDVNREGDEVAKATRKVLKQVEAKKKTLAAKKQMETFFDNMAKEITVTKLYDMKAIVDDAANYVKHLIPPPPGDRVKVERNDEMELDPRFGLHQSVGQGDKSHSNNESIQNSEDLNEDDGYYSPEPYSNEEIMETDNCNTHQDSDAHASDIDSLPRLDEEHASSPSGDGFDDEKTSSARARTEKRDQDGNEDPAMDNSTIG
jgi:hypothetical protein